MKIGSKIASWNLPELMKKIAYTNYFTYQLTSLWYMNGSKMDYNISLLVHFLKYHDYLFCQSQPKIVHLIRGAYIIFMENFLNVHNAQSDKNYQN